LSSWASYGHMTSTVVFRWEVGREERRGGSGGRGGRGEGGGEGRDARGGGMGRDTSSGGGTGRWGLEGRDVDWVQGIDRA